MEQMPNLCTPTEICENHPNRFLFIIEVDNLAIEALLWDQNVVLHDDTKMTLSITKSLERNEVALLHQQAWINASAIHIDKDYIECLKSKITSKIKSHVDE